MSSKPKIKIEIGKPLSLLQVPARTAPMQLLPEIKAIADRLAPGEALEVDSTLISEHSVRNYLRQLAATDTSYRDYIVRTAAGTSTTGRRRIFITRIGSMSIVAGNGDEVVDGDLRP